MATVHDPSVAETASVEIDGPGMNVRVKCSGPCNAQISERHGEMKVTLEVGTKRRRTEGGAGGSSLPPAVSQQFQLERIQRENKERERLIVNFENFVRKLKIWLIVSKVRTATVTDS